VRRLIRAAKLLNSLAANAKEGHYAREGIFESIRPKRSNGKCALRLNLPDGFFTIFRALAFSLAGVAQGMIYLHDNGVVHATLCADNVRVNDSLTAKLSECCSESALRYKLVSLVLEKIRLGV